MLGKILKKATIIILIILFSDFKLSYAYIPITEDSLNIALDIKNAPVRFLTYTITEFKDFLFSGLDRNRQLSLPPKEDSPALENKGEISSAHGHSSLPSSTLWQNILSIYDLTLNGFKTAKTKINKLFSIFTFKSPYS